MQGQSQPSLSQTPTQVTQTQELFPLSLPYEEEASDNQGPAGYLLSLNPKFLSVELVKDRCSMGRSPRCDVVFKEKEISACHCQFYIENIDGHYTYSVEDLSTNGTFVNAQRIKKKTKKRLFHGDIIALCQKKVQSRMFVSYVFRDIRQAMGEDIQDEIYQDYTIENELGKGNFSIVKKAIHRKTGEEVAVKIIQRKKLWQGNESSVQIEREIDILKRLDHPNIVSYKAFYVGEKKMYIVLELATGGELFDRITKNGTISENESRRIFRQILYGVIYLHQNDIAHRDIKPENLLLDSRGNVKITDFGLARVAGEATLMTTMCGTPEYVAPEVVKAGMRVKNGEDVGYGKSVDMWSLGIVLYVMLTGEPPFTESERTKLYSQINSGRFQFPDTPKYAHISTAAKDLIGKLVTVNPKQRYTAPQCLNHHWLTPALSPVQLKRARSDIAYPFVWKQMTFSHVDINWNFSPRMGVSWSTSGVLAVAIGSSVYIWHSHSEPVIQSCAILLADAPVSAVSFSDSISRFLAVSAAQKGVMLWDIDKNHVMNVFTDHDEEGSVTAIAWNMQFLATGGDDGRIHIHDVSIQDHLVHTFRIPDPALRIASLEWCKNTTTEAVREYPLASLMTTGELFIWKRSDSSSSSAQSSESATSFVKVDHSDAFTAFVWCAHRPDFFYAADVRGFVTSWQVQDQQATLFAEYADHSSLHRHTESASVVISFLFASTASHTNPSISILQHSLPTPAPQNSPSSHSVAPTEVEEKIVMRTRSRMSQRKERSSAKGDVGTMSLSTWLLSSSLTVREGVSESSVVADTVAAAVSMSQDGSLVALWGKDSVLRLVRVAPNPPPSDLPGPAPLTDTSRPVKRAKTTDGAAGDVSRTDTEVAEEGS